MKNLNFVAIGLAALSVIPSCSGEGEADSPVQAGRGGASSTGGAPAGGALESGGGTDEGGAGERSEGGAGASTDAGGMPGGEEPTGGALSEGGAGAPPGGGGAAGGERVDTCVHPAAATLAGASVPTGYCAFTWASGLSKPRGILVDARGDVLVSEAGRISLLHDDDGDGVSGAAERVVLRTEAGLNHGIALRDGYLYASTATTVYRWPYASDRQALGEPQLVVTGMPSGGHATRTLELDADGRLYVSIGSASNVDANSNRARLVRYPASALASTSTFAQGELFADGLRNEVGLTLDERGRLWGVENGRDNLQRPDLGTDIQQDNPGEELNLFLESNAGRFYGYPYCWSEYDLPETGGGRGTQWADPNNTTHDDAWCKNPTNVLPPVLVMQGHSAPLDIEFYPGGSFPEDVVGDALVTFHGSWNRTTATGYKVMRIPFGADGMPSGEPVPLLESANPGDKDPQWPHRPVGLGIGKSGQVFVTSDASGVILAIGHAGD